MDGHVRMGIAAQLATIDQGFRTIASFAQLKRTPIVIGESDPEGCAACQGSPLAYRNGTMYSSYTAAVFARKHDLARRHGVNLEGALTWAFEFEDQPYFAGFRALAEHGPQTPGSFADLICRDLPGDLTPEAAPVVEALRGWRRQRSPPCSPCPCCWPARRGGAWLAGRCQDSASACPSRCCRC